MSKVLRKKVLVLNKSWVAISVTSVRKALRLLFKEGALVIDPEQHFQTFNWSDWQEIEPKVGEEFIKTTSIIFRIPEVIVLTEFNKVPMAQRVNFSRRNLYKRDMNTCQYCGVQPGTEELTIDHVLPRSLGGETAWTNCVLACVSCNSKKGNRTPEMADMKLKKAPEKPKFSLFKGDKIINSWKQFLDEAYWSTTLE